MKSIASLLKRLSSADDAHHEPLPANPSEVLHVHREDITGTLEIRRITPVDYNPSHVLRVSWIKRDDLEVVMNPVWIADEFDSMA